MESPYATHHRRNADHPLRAHRQIRAGSRRAFHQPRPRNPNPARLISQSPREPNFYRRQSPAPPDITLDPNLMWTSLPLGVFDAIQGNAGQVWLTTAPPPGKLTHEAAQALIRREYAQPLAQASFAVPVLFEPKGRIWFIV